MRLVFFCLMLAIYPARAAGPLFQVAIDDSKAPECEAFAQKSKAVVEEWYPKISEILFGMDHPLPTNLITLVCEPAKFIAWTDIKKNRIHISSGYVSQEPEAYGTVVHELTHIVQHYVKLKKEEVWLQEGIADYIRHQYFEHDIDRLALAVDPVRDTYRKGYRVTAALLDWLQKHKDPTVIRDLNGACAEGHCAVDLFPRFCGADVDTLWAEFAKDLKTAQGIS
jgi:hypothetical protein